MFEYRVGHPYTHDDAHLRNISTSFCELPKIGAIFMLYPLTMIIKSGIMIMSIETNEKAKEERPSWKTKN